MFSFGRRADRCCATPSWPCSHVFAENSLPWLTDLWIECARNLLRLRLCSRGLRLPPHVGEFRRIGHLGACPKAFLYCCNVKPLLSNWFSLLKTSRKTNWITFYGLLVCCHFLFKFVTFRTHLSFFFFWLSFLVVKRVWVSSFAEADFVHSLSFTLSDVLHFHSSALE